jgi:DNA-binding transcriptional MocR family regulator
MLGPREVVARAEDAMTACYGRLPLSHAHVAERAFARIGYLAQRARASLLGKRERVAAWVGSHESLGLEWSAPTDGLFALVMVPGSDDATPEIESMAREHDVLIVPGALFGVPNAFRIAWSAPAAALEDGLALLGEIVTERLRPSG